MNDGGRRQMLRALGACAGVGAASLWTGCAAPTVAHESGGLPVQPSGVSGFAPAGTRRIEQIAPGVYLQHGLRGEIGPDTLGRSGNAGFIVGASGVLAINSGGSHRDGQALLAAITRSTALPLRGVLLTHAMQEFIFGASAFQAAGVPVLMHHDAARLMAVRCESCLKTLQRVLGADEMAGTRVPRADITFTTADATRALPDIGRPLRLLAPAAIAASPGDSAVFDDTSATLFAGALLDADTIPDVQDADLAGWHAALAALQGLPLRRIVPGHGPAAGTGLVESVDSYLRQLEQRTAALLQAGTALSEVADAVDLPAFAHWQRYDSTHRRNASIVFLRQERALMLKDARHGT